MINFFNEITNHRKKILKAMFRSQMISINKKREILLS